MQYRSVLIGLQGLLRNSTGQCVFCAVLAFSLEAIYGQGNRGKEIYLYAYHAAVTLVKNVFLPNFYLLWSISLLKSASMQLFVK